MNKCSVSECARVVWAKGLCNSHYANMRRRGYAGKPIKQKWQILQEMLQTRDRSTGCWVNFPGTSATTNGYWTLKFGGRSRVVGQVILELEGLPQPKGMEVLHSCDNKRCFNPTHLRWGTRRENVLEAIDRGLRPGKVQL